MRIRISSDSTCDLSPELVARNDVSIIPLHIVKDGTPLRDVEALAKPSAAAAAKAADDHAGEGAVGGRVIAGRIADGVPDRSRPLRQKRIERRGGRTSACAPSNRLREPAAIFIAWFEVLRKVILRDVTAC